MNQEIKRLWIEALRSGRYKQGIGKLCQRDSQGVLRFCCLGVLCDVLRVPYKEEPNPVEEVRRLYGADECIFHLPEEVTSVAGVSEDVVVPRKEVEDLLFEYGLAHQDYGDSISLALLNDSRVPFDKIADVIERAL